MQRRVYKTPVRDTADLKQRLIETWLNTPQTVVDKATDSEGIDFFRLQACVKEKGHHFEHTMTNQ